MKWELCKRTENKIHLDLWSWIRQQFVFIGINHRALTLPFKVCTLLVQNEWGARTRVSDGIGARVDLAVLSTRVWICPPHSLIERERDKQVERLPVGTNRSGISIERQRQSLQGERERGWVTIQRKSKRSKGMQAGDSHCLKKKKKNVSATNKLSCSHTPRHGNKRLFLSFRSWQSSWELGLGHGVGSYRVELLYISHQRFRITRGDRKGARCQKI